MGILSIYAIRNGFIGFQEAPVGALVTLNPEDKEGKQAFRAADFGLKPEEKELRQQFARQWQAQHFGGADQQKKLEENQEKS